MRFTFSALVCIAGLTLLQSAEGGDYVGAAGPAVPFQYIVLLDHDPGEGLSKLRPEISNFVAAGRIEIPSVWNSALDGFLMSGVDETTAKGMASLPGVLSVEADLYGQVEATQINPPVGLDALDQRGGPLNGVYTYNYTGSALHAYVVDSGIRITHQDFGGRATADVDFANDGHTDDAFGHGTEVASVIGGTKYGVVKQIHLHSVRVVDYAGNFSASQLISGLNWIGQHGIHPGVVNISLSLPSTAAVDTATAGLVSAGFFVSAAAGNRSSSTTDGFDDACTVSPARVPTAFTVGAPAIFSYRGPCVDMFAAGVHIAAATHNTDASWDYQNGTSFSAPHAAGAAALVMQQFPTLNIDQVSWELIARSTKGLLGGDPNWNLYGSPDRWLYSLSLGYTTVPSMPSLLTLDSCFPPHYLVDWSGGAVNSLNTPTYYQLQTSTNAAFSPVTNTYTDGSVATGYAQFTSATQLYARVRTCNSLGCSAFRNSSAASCH